MQFLKLFKFQSELNKAQEFIIFERWIDQRGTYVRHPVPPALHKAPYACRRGFGLAGKRDANATTTAGREHVNGPIAAGPEPREEAPAAAGPAAACHCPRTERW